MSNIDFINFINQNNIIESIVSTIIGFKTQELVESIIDNLILPIINRDADGDGESDINTLKKIKFKFSGITISIGSFILSLIKYILIIFLVYIFQKVFKNFS